MSDNYKWCHGPECHKKKTQDRVRGVKGHKVLRTRKIAATHWNQNSPWSVFCSNGCYNDFLLKYFRQVIAIAPRPEPLETSCEVTTRKVQGTSYNWQTNESEPHTYTEKTITVDNHNG
jgi:hypothetical protein